MKSNDIKQVRDAFARLSKSAGIEEFSAVHTIRIETDFKTFTSEPISFYAYKIPKSNKIFFTDAGRMYKQLEKSGQKLQDSVIQTLVESYGMSLLEDNSIIEQQDIPLHERISNIIQIQIGVDTLIRTWIGYTNKIKTKKETSNEIL